MLIGLSGYAQSGKDTFARFLPGYERAAFADALREMLYNLNPLTWVEAGGTCGPRYDNETVQTIVDRAGWEWAKAHSGIRELLQRLGTEAGRKVLGDNIWVDTLLNRIHLGKDWVVTDCRFPNEAQAIKECKGIVVRIVRPETGAVNRHQSETALDDWPFDVTIHNGSTLGSLAHAAEDLAASLRRR